MKRKKSEKGHLKNDNRCEVCVTEGGDMLDLSELQKASFNYLNMVAISTCRKFVDEANKMKMLSLEEVTVEIPYEDKNLIEVENGGLITVTLRHRTITITRKKLFQLMAELSEREHQVIYLYYFCGKTSDEKVGAQIGLSRSGCHDLRIKAERKLKGMLDNEEYEL